MITVLVFIILLFRYIKERRIENENWIFRIFTDAVNEKFINEADFVFANTEITTDTFNVLLPKSSYITNSLNLRNSIENMSLKEYPFSTWIDSNYLNASWQELMKEFDQSEAEHNVMMKLENTLNVRQRKFQQLMIYKDLKEYIEVFINLFGFLK